jgi:hypothetical protein
LLTITGVDQPPARAGTLVVDGQSLLYNRDPSWGGEFSVAYRALSATGAAGESTATFTVLPPVESELTFPSEPTAPIGGVLDANPSTFASVYAAAVGGQHLRLANGDYGDLLLTKTFPADRPLVIRAANKHRARLTGFVRPNGLGHWLHELELDRAPSGVITGDSDSDRARRLAQYQVQVVAVGNRYLWLTRNSVRSELGLRVGSGTKYIWVGWNRFDGESSQGYGAHIDIAQEPFTDPAAAVRDVLLYRNDFRDGSRRRSRTSMSSYTKPTKPVLRAFARSKTS